MVFAVWTFSAGLPKTCLSDDCTGEGEKKAFDIQYYAHRRKADGAIIQRMETNASTDHFAMGPIFHKAKLTQQYVAPCRSRAQGPFGDRWEGGFGASKPFLKPGDCSFVFKILGVCFKRVLCGCPTFVAYLISTQ